MASHWRAQKISNENRVHNHLLYKRILCLDKFQMEYIFNTWMFISLLLLYLPITYNKDLNNILWWSKDDTFYKNYCLKKIDLKNLNLKKKKKKKENLVWKFKKTMAVTNGTENNYWCYHFSGLVSWINTGRLSSLA